VSNIAMNPGDVSWDVVAVLGAVVGAVLAVWPLARTATKRATMQRRLTQAVRVLGELRESGANRPSTVALRLALEEVVDECATYLTVVERKWLRRTRSMFRFIMGIALSTLAVSGLVVLATLRDTAEVPTYVKFIILALVVLMYVLAGLATIREQLVKRQRVVDKEWAPVNTPVASLNTIDGPTVVIAVPPSTKPPSS
jgi:hypothetical protein